MAVGWKLLLSLTVAPQAVISSARGQERKQVVKSQMLLVAFEKQHLWTRCIIGGSVSPIVLLAALTTFSKAFLSKALQHSYQRGIPLVEHCVYGACI